MIVSPMGITTATPVVVKKPPYTGAVIYNHFVGRNLGGCNSHAAVITPGTFNSTSGIARIAVKAMTTVCAAGNGTAGVGGYLGVTDVGFKVSTSKRYNLSAYWSVKVGVNVSIFYKGNSTGSLAAYIDIIPNLCIIDTTSARTVACKAASSLVSATFSTNVSMNITVARADIIGGLSLIAGHSYDFRAFLGYGVAVVANSPAAFGSHLSAVLDMSSGNFNATLKSLTVV